MSQAAAESVMLVQIVASFRRIFEREEEALRSIRSAVHRQRKEGEGYEAGVDMGAFAVSGISMLEEQMRFSLSILEDLLGGWLPEKTLMLCSSPLLRINQEEGLLEVIERDLGLLSRKSKALGTLERELLSQDPQIISDSLPDHIKENIARLVEGELQNFTEKDTA